MERGEGSRWELGGEARCRKKVGAWRRSWVQEADWSLAEELGAGSRLKLGGGARCRKQVGAWRRSWVQEAAWSLEEVIGMQPGSMQVGG
mmetsp:Transcript_46579/g.146041  ORF Transcript_46579/g.146041 Transcript_46579/m.146041 type:complete len:89 (-) Transcript_46579:211-477(-)